MAPNPYALIEATATVEPDLLVAPGNESPDGRVVFLQARLGELGHQTTQDGRFGPKTAEALKAFQDRTDGVKTTGKLDPKTVKALRTGEPPETPAEEQAEAPAEEQAEQAGGTESAAEPKTTGVLRRGLGSGRRHPEVKEVQGQLNDMGYDIGDGGVDGRFGRATELGVKRFQRDHGLKADGVVGRHTRRMLSAVGQMVEAESERLEESLFRSELHPRARTGKFREVLGKVGAGAPQEPHSAPLGRGRRAESRLLGLGRPKDTEIRPLGAAHPGGLAMHVTPVYEDRRKPKTPFAVSTRTPSGARTMRFDSREKAEAYRAKQKVGKAEGAPSPGVAPELAASSASRTSTTKLDRLGGLSDRALGRLLRSRDPHMRTLARGEMARRGTTIRAEEYTTTTLPQGRRRVRGAASPGLRPERHIAANGHELKVGDYAEMGSTRGRVAELAHSARGEAMVKLDTGDGGSRGGPARSAYKIEATTEGGLTRLGGRLPLPGAASPGLPDSNHTPFGEHPDEIRAAPLNTLAALAARDWKNVSPHARPYLDAMASLNHIDENYGADSGRSVVAYFLSNAAGWKGPLAKEVKGELRRRTKSPRGASSPGLMARMTGLDGKASPGLGHRLNTKQLDRIEKDIRNRGHMMSAEELRSKSRTLRDHNRTVPRHRGDNRPLGMASPGVDQGLLRRVQNGRTIGGDPVVFEHPSGHSVTRNPAGSYDVRLPNGEHAHDWISFADLPAAKASIETRTAPAAVVGGTPLPPTPAPPQTDMRPKPPDTLPSPRPRSSATRWAKPTGDSPRTRAYFKEAQRRAAMGDDSWLYDESPNEIAPPAAAEWLRRYDAFPGAASPGIVRTHTQAIGPGGKPRNVKAMGENKLRVLLNHPTTDETLRARIVDEMRSRGLPVPKGAQGVAERSAERSVGRPQTAEEMLKGSKWDPAAKAEQLRTIRAVYSDSGGPAPTLMWRGQEIPVESRDDMADVSKALRAIGEYNGFHPAETAGLLGDMEGDIAGVTPAREGSVALYIRPVSSPGAAQRIAAELKDEASWRGTQGDAPDEVDVQPDGSIRVWWD